MKNPNRLRPSAGGRGPAHRSLLLILAAVLASIASMAIAQEAPPEAMEPRQEDAELTAADQTIEVEAPAEDEEIAERLRGILEATGRFVEPQVEVKDEWCISPGAGSRSVLP